MRAVGDDGPQELDRVDRTSATIAVGPLVGPVLARIVAIHGARADLPVDRLNDAVLVALSGGLIGAVLGGAFN